MNTHNYNHYATSCLKDLMELDKVERKETKQQSESKHQTPHSYISVIVLNVLGPRAPLKSTPFNIFQRWHTTNIKYCVARQTILFFCMLLFKIFIFQMPDSPQHSVPRALTGVVITSFRQSQRRYDYT